MKRCLMAWMLSLCLIVPAAWGQSAPEAQAQQIAELLAKL